MPEPPAITLAIETSNPTAHEGAAGVALVRTSGVTVEPIAAEPLRPESRHDDALMPAIDRLLRANHLAPSDLSAVAVSIGPGGYTSTRIAVTTAKVICRFTGAKAIPVPTDLGVLEALEIEPNITLSVCLAWKRDEVWLRTFAPDADPANAPPGRIRNLADLTDPALGLLVCDSKLGEKLGDHGLMPIRFDPLAVARASAKLAPVDPIELSVAYPREPEAVRNWRAMGR